MRSFAKKQYQLENPVSSSVVRANIATIGLQHRRSDSEELDTPPTATAFPRFEHDFLRIHVHPPAAGALKTKLLINKPGDEYERDAERISQQAMRAPELQLQRACTCGGTCPECQARHSAHEYDRLETKQVGSGDLGQIAVPPIVDEVLVFS